MSCSVVRHRFVAANNAVTSSASQKEAQPSATGLGAGVSSCLLPRSS
jgi:hypothetical protein